MSVASCQWIVFAGAGTFAVVCLMIGTAVNNANCDVGLPSSSSSSAQLLNSTVTAFTEATTSVSKTPTPSADSVDETVMQCRVGVAVALTFLAGVYQVIYLLTQ